MLKLNRVIQEIEDHVGVDVEKLARHALTSENHLRRMFGTLAGMSLAATDLRSGEAVLDVAIKYGYASSEAFSRAFRRFHGVNPSEVRLESTTLRSQPRLCFHIQVKGVTDLRYHIVDKVAFYLSGFHRR